MDSAVTVRFGGDTAGLNAAVDQARQVLARFAPGVTREAGSSLDALRAALDRNTGAIQSNTGGWRANLQAAAAVVTVLRGVKDAIEEVADVELRGDAILARSLGAIARSDLVVATNTIERVATAARGAGAAIDGGFRSGFEHAEAAIGSFARANGLALASVADAGAIMAVAAAGGLGAFRAEVEVTASAVRARMAQIEADTLHLKRSFAERDPASGREIGQSTAPRGGSAAIVADMMGAESGFVETDGAFKASVVDEVMAGQIERTGASIKSVDETLRGFIAGLREIPDTSKEVATAIQAAITTIPAYTLDANDAFVTLLKSVASTGAEAQALGDDVRKAFADGRSGGADLAAVLERVGDATTRVDLASRLARQLQPAQAVSFFAAIQTGVERQRDGLRAIDADYEAQHAKLNAIGRLIEAHVGSSLKEHAARQETIATLGEQTEILERQVRVWTEIAAKVKEAADFAAALKTASTTPAARIDDLGRRRDALAGRAQRLPNETGITEEQRDLAARVAVLEAGGEGERGIEAVVDVMRNRLASGRFGADLDAVLTKPKQFSAYSRDKVAGVDTESEAYTSAYEAVTRQFGPKPDADVTKGATSYLNPATATDRSWIDKMSNVTDIGRHRFGNVGDTPVHGDDVERQRREALQATNKELREQGALEAGGTAEAKLSADIAERDLTTAKDAVAEAQAMVDKRRETLAIAGRTPEAGGGTAAEQMAARTALIAAEDNLKTQVAARDRAREALAIAGTQEGSRARLDATLASLERQQAGYARDSAEYLGFERQKVEAGQAFRKAEASDAASAEAVRYDAGERGFKEQGEQIRENARLGVITAAEGESQTLANLARQTEAERAHFTALQRIWADMPKEYRKATQGLEQVDARSHQLRDAAERAYLAEVRQTYRQVFEQVGSNVSSSIMGMIAGTTTFKSAAVGVAREILTMFIQSRVRIVADWLAGEAAKVQATVAGETAKTSAVATGEGARTGLVSLGAAVQAAQVGAGMVKSILGSAAETFAGIFGFLSPVMGPAAVGPAVAGQAAVAAVASAVPSFAIGAWSLPTDMVAQVHAGEMIVPAGPAALMRAAAGQGAAPAGGGATHHHTHFNVTAMDSRDVRRFFGDNAKHIIGAIKDGVRSGSHLGIGKLRS